MPLPQQELKARRQRNTAIRPLRDELDSLTRLEAPTMSLKVINGMSAELACAREGTTLCRVPSGLRRRSPERPISAEHFLQRRQCVCPVCVMTGPLDGE